MGLTSDNMANYDKTLFLEDNRISSAIIETLPIGV